MYLRSIDREDLIDEVGTIIDMHHLMSVYKGKFKRLTEAFRKADLVDFSWGFIRSGVERSVVKHVKGQLPNAGFHLALCRFTLLQLTRNPLNPLPMMRAKIPEHRK